MSKLVLVVTVTLDPDCVERLRPAMLENAARSRLEEGCHGFDVNVSQDDPNTFLFYEVYSDADALKRHRRTPHFLNYWNLLRELGDKAERKAQLYDKLG